MDYSKEPLQIDSTAGKKKPVPVLFQRRENCCGCSACYAVCPVQAISMEEDEEGFLYPKISSEKCIGCRRCLSVCAFKRDQEARGHLNTVDFNKVPDQSDSYQAAKYDKPVPFAVKHKDLDVRNESSSGGMFTALSDQILSENGIIYGCMLNDSFHAVHERAEDREIRNQMRGSKYVQSEMRDSFFRASEDLKSGKKVLFTGTPCQIAGLNSYLGKEYDRLLCADLVCLGVPSPKVWRDYLKWVEKRHRSRIIFAQFRNKKDYGWSKTKEKLVLENGKQIDSHDFLVLFYNRCILRPCCYHCPYKDVIHPGNLTIGDYWGIDKVIPGYNDERGVSLVLINDGKGSCAFETIRDKVDAIRTEVEECLQPSLIAPCEEPKKRAELWNTYLHRSFPAFMKKYSTGYAIKAIRTLKSFLVR